VTDVATQKLRMALQEGLAHVRHLARAWHDVAQHIPFTAESYQTLSPLDVRALDQFVFRFSKLQDALGLRLYPALLQAGGDWRDEQTFLDRLHLLERLKILSSVEDWTQLRQLRNLLAHEYPDDPGRNAAALNLAFNQAHVLVEHLMRARTFAVAHFHLQATDFPMVVFPGPAGAAHGVTLRAATDVG